MDLLYGNQRKMLKILYKNYKKNIPVTKVKLSKFLNLNYQETTQLCKDLYDKGFIVYIGLNHDPKINLKGIEYFSAETASSMETILKSIICPVIVSAITTLLTLWLKG